MFFSIFFFILGAIIASFVGVVVARLHTGQSFLTGRSYCDACNAPLTSLSLVPIISFFTFGGRARCCGARLSLLAPATELLLGGLFVLSYLSFGLTLLLIPFAVSLSLLLALVLYDLQHQVLPPILLTLFIATSSLFGFLTDPSFIFLYSFLTALCIAASLALIHFLSRGRAMGFADAPLSFGLSLLVGSAAIPGFVFSFWIGAVIGLFILFKRPKGSRMGIEVPFAPFLAAGFLLAYFTQWNPFVFVAILP